MFLSSHLMSEMAQTADHVIVLGRGRIVADAPVAEIVAQGQDRTLVRSDQEAASSRPVWPPPGSSSANWSRGCWKSPAPSHARSPGLPGEHDALIHELTPVRASLEEAYMALTRDDVEYRSGALAGAEEGDRR